MKKTRQGAGQGYSDLEISARFSGLIHVVFRPAVTAALSRGPKKESCVVELVLEVNQKEAPDNGPWRGRSFIPSGWKFSRPSERSLANGEQLTALESQGVETSCHEA